MIRRFYAARRGGLKEEMFGYVPGGYGRILTALETRLKESGVEIKTGARVASIKREHDAIQVNSGDHSFKFDKVINTCAGPIVANTCIDLSDLERKQHNDITYQGIVCASLLLTRPLGGAYLTYITDESLPFTTVIEMSSLVERSLLSEHHLVYLPKYLPVDDPLLTASDQEVETLFLDGLMRMFPDLSHDDIKAIRVTRTRYVVPLSTKHYSSNLPDMASSVPGLYIINSAQIVNASLTVDDTVNLANRGAQYVIDREHEALV